MENVARTSHERQITMSDERDRLRRQLAEQFAPLVAEMAVKVDKASKHMTLLDLQSPRASAIYIERAVDFLLMSSQQRRVDVQAAKAHDIAEREKPNEDAAAQARQDISKYGNGSGRVN